MNKPTKDSTEQEVYTYAMWLYGNDEQKAKRYLRGWNARSSKT